MNSISKQDGKRPLTTRREFIFWYGGVWFGGIMTLTNIGYDLMRHSERYTPLWPPTGRVYFSWLLTLILTSVISFIVGSLFGLFMWAIVTRLKTSG